MKGRRGEGEWGRGSEEEDIIKTFFFSLLFCNIPLHFKPSAYEK
jgi:hypothetical protein